jgi:hypothetical protein
MKAAEKLVAVFEEIIGTIRGAASRGEMVAFAPEEAASLADILQGVLDDVKRRPGVGDDRF